MNPRTERLRELMKARELTDAQVADILGLSATTVRIYRCKTECSKTIPARALELLELRTADKLTVGVDVAGDRVEHPIVYWNRQ